MDMRLLSLMTAVIAVIFFLIGRRTAPGARTVHRLQREIDLRSAELVDYKFQMTQFLQEMRGEMSRLSHVQHDFEHRLVAGASRLKIALPAAPALAPLVVTSQVAAHNKELVETGTPSDELMVRDLQSTRRVAIRPDRSAVNAAACPIPADHFRITVPKDYADDFEDGKAVA